MQTIDGCQIPGLARIGEAYAEDGPRSPFKRFKRTFAKPWNSSVKPQLKKIYLWFSQFQSRTDPASHSTALTPSAGVVPLSLKAGDYVRVRSREEIQATLNPFKEYKGCAFLDEMWPYCDTIQRVLKPMERFLDERDYKVKKSRGLVLLEGVNCPGTPVYGRCDRCCFLFWREEWLEKIDEGRRQE